MHVRGQSRGYREPGAGRQGAHTVSGTMSKSILLKKIYDTVRKMYSVITRACFPQIKCPVQWDREGNEIFACFIFYLLWPVHTRMPYASQWGLEVTFED